MIIQTPSGQLPIPASGDWCPVRADTVRFGMNLSSFIWSVADLLRGKYKPHEYGQVILPFTVLHRIDGVLEPTKQAVLKEAAKRDVSVNGVNHYLARTSGNTFYDTSAMDLKAIVGDQDVLTMVAGLSA